MTQLPTDRDIIRCIYEMYESAYPGAASGQVRGENDPYLPVDLNAVAHRLNCKPEILFGRLYYHLDAKHRYKQDNGASVHLFHLNIQGKGNTVHFPYLASILASHDQEYRKQFWSIAFSVLAIVLSVAALVVNILTKG